MTFHGEKSRDWREDLGDRVWARWRWMIAFVAIVFVVNNVVGLVVGGLGLLAFANRLAGRALRARRLAQQARQIVAESPDE